MILVKNELFKDLKTKILYDFSKLIDMIFLLN